MWWVGKECKHPLLTRRLAHPPSQTQKGYAKGDKEPGKVGGWGFGCLFGFKGPTTSPFGHSS